MARLPLFPCYVAVCLLTLLPAARVGAGQEFALHSTTDVQAQPEQPAGAPILFTVKLTNTGKQPIRYWVALGMGKYPPASLFKAQITDRHGNVQDMEMSSDSRQVGGSGGFCQVLPGESITFPAVVRPFPPGVYTIQVRKGKSAQVTVKKDEELARRWDREMLERIRQGDSFAQHVAAKYPTKGLVGDLLEELASDDPKAAYRAAQPLSHIRELPIYSSQYISKGLTKQIDLAKQGFLENTSILCDLANLASRVGTDEALEALLKLAQTENVRGDAVFALGKFKQEKAVNQLRAFLKDEDKRIQFSAAEILADRKDPAALEVLLVIAYDPKNRWWEDAVNKLTKFPADPRVVLALTNASQSPDSRIRESARIGLRQLEIAKKQKP